MSYLGKYSLVGLSDQEISELSKLKDRLTRLADYAKHKNVKIMIDAEQTYFQPAISLITTSLMQRFNRDSPLILNTYQAYLRGTLNVLQADLHLSKLQGFAFGCKLVRGAYMNQERTRAKLLCYDDPINPSYEATRVVYNECLERIVGEYLRRKPGQVMVMVASHNEETIKFALNMMNDNRISPVSPAIYFAQLYGMCDHISFSLGQTGYNICKCLHYGPLEGVLPYLSRRAQENGSMLKNLGRERRLLWTELKRRILND